jgi:hypothetical protein
MQEKPKDVLSVGRKTQWCKRPNRWRLQSGKRPKANYQAPVCVRCRTITLEPVERLLLEYGLLLKTRCKLHKLSFFWQTNGKPIKELLYLNTLACNIIIITHEYFFYFMLNEWNLNPQNCLHKLICNGFQGPGPGEHTYSLPVLFSYTIFINFSFIGCVW